MAKAVRPLLYSGALVNLRPDDAEDSPQLLPNPRDWFLDWHAGAQATSVSILRFCVVRFVGHRDEVRGGAMLGDAERRRDERFWICRAPRRPCVVRREGCLPREALTGWLGSIARYNR